VSSPSASASRANFGSSPSRERKASQEIFLSVRRGGPLAVERLYKKIPP